jgi:hypothetical protein
MRLPGCLLAAVCMVFINATSAFAQGTDQRRPEEKIEPYQKHRDARHGHNHIYPDRGSIFRELPHGAVVINYAGISYRFHDGVWFEPQGPAYIVVAPPIGLVVPTLPSYATTVGNGKQTFLYANDVYYEARPDLGGYEVVNDPAETAAPAAAEVPAAADSQSESATPYALPTATAVAAVPVAAAAAAPAVIGAAGQAAAPATAGGLAAAGAVPAATAATAVKAIPLGVGYNGAAAGPGVAAVGAPTSVGGAGAISGAAAAPAATALMAPPASAPYAPTAAYAPTSAVGAGAGAAPGGSTAAYTAAAGTAAVLPVPAVASTQTLAPAPTATSAPATGGTSTASHGVKVFAYPKNGQTPEVQARDQYECYRFGVAQSGFDPMRASGAPAAQIADRQLDFERAQGACFEGRGYTIR